MKCITLILVLSANITFARFCEDYITDEWPDSRYAFLELPGHNVVIDKKTGLMWKQCSEGLSGDACLTGTVSRFTW